MAYPFVQQFYDHSLPQAEAYARQLFAERDLDNGEYRGTLFPVLRCLDALGIANWSSLLSLINTRDDLLVFLEKTGLRFEQVIDSLLFLFRWGLPFYTATRELLDHDNAQEMAYYEALKLHKLTSSFDLLEGGRMPSGRKDLVKMTGLPELGQFQVCHPSERAGRWRPGITICG